MPYSKTIWVDGGAPPIDASNLNNLEDGVSKAPYGPDASAGFVPVGDGSGAWVYEKLPASSISGYPAAVADVLRGDGSWGQVADAQIAAAAGIAKSKLAALDITNADVDAAAAIAYSKLNLAASIAQSDMAAGNKITAQAISAGPPSSPSDGDIWIATAVDANGTTWAFRYSSSETTYKWEFIGGFPSTSGPLGSISTTSASFVDLTSGPTLTLARAGDYLVRFGAFTQSGAAAVFGMDVRALVGATGSTKIQFISTVNLSGGNISGEEIFSGVAAGSGIKLQVETNGNSATFSSGWLDVLPRRII